MSRIKDSPSRFLSATAYKNKTQGGFSQKSCKVNYHVRINLNLAFSLKNSLKNP